MDGEFEMVILSYSLTSSTGKTMLASAVAQECGLHFIRWLGVYALTLYRALLLLLL